MDSFLWRSPAQNLEVHLLGPGLQKAHKRNNVPAIAISNCAKYCPTAIRTR
ncbi:MAG: hypothetical protein JGK26_22845 [Microcoleus sp. PH2017_27_LUM_O_A]|uniref:hypothetical protein n=1 Tax=Microcoleus sp. PH2017_27_LUM_O_A TaxID=2798837 RepID=UPI001DF6A522|nr:hypothetical protein [Microcoleus sp. PH2017_27_LUM_O_A]MCC3462520.1 hypothetical protein [Microcoleus sp. PH2017_11_PCY_U_A]MCC3561915.1 hypothetical protein [Microcoleus sp. PH2017_27_LUM_O_A]